MAAVGKRNALWRQGAQAILSRCCGRVAPCQRDPPPGGSNGTRSSAGACAATTWTGADLELAWAGTPD